jgi:membrane protease YdiL (CAAX protease family)
VLPTPEDPAGPPSAGSAGSAEPVPTWGLGDVAATLGVTLLLGSLVAVAVDALAPASGHGVGRAWGSVALLVLPWAALGGWPVLASLRKGNGPRRDFGLTLTWPLAATGFVGGLCGLAVAVVVGVVQQAVTNTTLSSAVGTIASSTTSASSAAVAVLAACAAFGAPVVEELAFRGLTYGALLKRGVSPRWSVAGVTVLFALFHFEPQRILVLLVLGATLALVRMWTGSTAASMVAHVTVNIPGALAILSLVRR